MARGFVSTMNRIARDMERSARASQRAVEQQRREQLRALRDAERAERAYQRALIADEKEAKRQYVEMQLEDAESQTKEIESQVQALASILGAGLESNSWFSFASLLVQPTVVALDLNGIARAEAPPRWENHEPRRLSWLAALMPWKKSAYEKQVLAAKKSFDEIRQSYERKESARQNQIRERHSAHEQAVARAKSEADAHNATVKDFEAAFQRREPEAITTFFESVLRVSSYPNGFPQMVKAEYQAESKQLIIAYDFPEYDEVIPKIKSVKYVKSSDSFNEAARPENQRRTLYADVVAQTSLRSLHEIFVSDKFGIVETVVFNGYVQAIDKATGKPIHPCVVTVRTSRDAFCALELANVDPLACLRALNATVSKSASELAPVRPILELNMSDPRFIEEADVLSTLDQRPNLMDLTPGEFESLITNLFQAMGLETRQTQASRDGGVDCVAFDPRPIFGGKVVIQAKRYKNTVGVSAVRDLFGTMQNEGASKGILVTTSGYGKAAFEFANGKPIELLAGSNLLYLLKENADIDAKIIMPEDWVDIRPDD